ncbi:Uncharacterised protein [Candidatus Tiddalikarchaeum anstoanum]|nr:Uncharacterised protein [Candidatus Tiddalikarchaeum anstoanum]
MFKGNIRLNMETPYNWCLKCPKCNELICEQYHSYTCHKCNNKIITKIPLVPPPSKLR